MELPPKALHALIDIKKELLSRGVVEEIQAAPEKSRKSAAPPVTFRQRRARSSGAYQRGCQSHKFWSPVH